jgi:hypothetical protein
MKPNFASAPGGSVAKRYSDDTIAKCHNQVCKRFPMNRRIAYASLALPLAVGADTRPDPQPGIIGH